MDAAADRIATLRAGMEEDPGRLDRFGHPHFRKELMRLLLSQGRWAEAEALIPSGVEATGWHHILFARALDGAGRAEDARTHWQAFAAHHPGHPEAQKALGMPRALRQIRSRVPDQRFEMIFDVGANRGQSCLHYAVAFPEARIHAFEPAPAAFAELTRASAAHGGISCHNLALSQSEGTLRMALDGSSTMNRVLDPATPEGTPIPARRLDRVCADLGIDHIDFLKIDTEGHDLAVLHGAGAMLDQIDFIQCETSANRYNRLHVAFGEVFDLLTDAGFYLFHIDGQTYEWGNGGYPVLRRFDPIFINARRVGLIRGVRDRC